MRWILLVLLALLLPLEVQAAKGRKSSKPYIGKEVHRFIDRELGKDSDFSGYLLHQREKGGVTTIAVFADCNEGTVCAYHETRNCYLDSDWVYFAPDTKASQIFNLTCRP